MRRLVSLVAIALVSTTFGSCSLFVSSMQSVVITSTDPQADIIVDGNQIGRGAATVDLQRNRTHSVMARDGDRVAAVSIGNSISTTGALDIIGTFFFLIPIIGIAGPGFWSLDNTTVVLNVPPAPAAHQSP